MQLNILRVYPKVREFSGKNGPLAVVKVAFDDDTEGEYLTTPDAAPKVQEALTAFIGKPTDFELGEEKEYQGVTQRKIKSWPGKQSSGGFAGGGGKQWTPAFSQTKEGFLIEQTMMNARTSVMQGVANGTCKDWTPDQMMQWMQGKLKDALQIIGASDAPKQPQPPTPPVNVQNASPSLSAPSTDVVEDDGAQTLPGFGNLNTTGEQCKVCFAPPNMRHAKGCTA